MQQKVRNRDFSICVKLKSTLLSTSRVSFSHETLKSALKLTQIVIDCVYVSMPSSYNSYQHIRDKKIPNVKLFISVICVNVPVYTYINIIHTQKGPYTHVIQSCKYYSAMQSRYRKDAIIRRNKTTVVEFCNQCASSNSQNILY